MSIKTTRQKRPDRVIDTKQDNREIKILWEEKEFKSITNAGQFFDMICVRNYMAGSLGQKIPVDENRCGFKKLKLLLIK